jgi:RimJ/RimL family protein N-acetyltransferase
VQRTHVLTHAAGLFLHRFFDLPAQGGLGLRRVQWITTTLNQASQNAAKRLGFKEEGIVRAAKVLPVGKKGVRGGYSSWGSWWCSC